MSEESEKVPPRGPEIRLKRVYERAEKSDGHRVLTERLWPRGLTKERVAVEQWVKHLAPSHALRKFYGHREERWPVFREAYLRQLQDDPELEGWVEELRRYPVVTLVYSSKGERISTVVLADLLRRRLALEGRDVGE